MPMTLTTNETATLLGRIMIDPTVCYGKPEDFEVVSMLVFNKR